MPLIECVPNVSEGRDRRRIQGLVDTVTRTRDVHVLDVHQDRFHHRSVFTIVGPPEAVPDAVFDLAGACIASVDLRHHEGEHPRMGAIDVIPFVPLHDVSPETCVALAGALAERIAGEMNVPTFLYGQAARTDARRRLAAVRGGGFEALQTAIGRDPGRQPDFGPAAVHPSAGATAVGVRDFLVAFNVQLDTSDTGVAREIARRIRTAGGGRAGIQALGFSVGGRAQVSMNLFDLRRTTTLEAFDDVVTLARTLGVQIGASEIVGLAPAAALPPRGDRIALGDTVESHSLEAALARRYPDITFRLLP